LHLGCNCGEINEGLGRRGENCRRAHRDSGKPDVQFLQKNKNTPKLVKKKEKGFNEE